MMNALRIGFVILIAAAFGFGVGILTPRATQSSEQEDLEFLKARLELLESEVERLRALAVEHQQSERQEKNNELLPELEDTASRLRDLPFLKPVMYQEINKDVLPEFLEQLFRDHYTEEELEVYRVSMVEFGLLAHDLDFKDAMIRLLSEQIAAFFDQTKGHLVTFSDTNLSRPHDRIIMVHELVHALQDQHYNLDNYELDRKDNDDQVMAIKSLIEGDASLVMAHFTQDSLSAEFAIGTLSAAFAQPMEELSRAPRFLRESLVFPYLKGLEFADALYRQGGMGAINRAFQDPPTSTSQILHPEKYFQVPREDPIEVDWPESAILGQLPLATNNFGEFGIQVWLGEWLPKASAVSAAEGWRGDRYAVYDAGHEGRAHIAWLTMWESEQSASEFLDAVKEAVSSRYKPGSVEETTELFSFDHPRAIRVLQPSPSTVLFVDALEIDFADEAMTQIAEHFIQPADEPVLQE
ncbi:MAG: hypothetical protein ACFCU3_04190 [Verrucomicrobiales bacterium]